MELKCHVIGHVHVFYLCTYMYTDTYMYVRMYCVYSIHCTCAVKQHLYMSFIDCMIIL